MNESLTKKLIRNGYDPELLWKICCLSPTGKNYDTKRMERNVKPATT